MNRQDEPTQLTELAGAKQNGIEIVRLVTLLERVLGWRGLDGDGITDPLRGDILRELGRGAG